MPVYNSSLFLSCLNTFGNFVQGFTLCKDLAFISKVTNIESFIAHAKSFVSILNQKESSAEPCGIPLDNDFQVLKLIHFLTIYFLSVMQLHMSFRLLMPNNKWKIQTLPQSIMQA